MAELADLRARIDELDQRLVDVVAERLAVCAEVARRKEAADTPVIQPSRVREVLTTRRQAAITAGVDPDFVEQLFRVLLTETHRIEVAGGRPDPAPDKAADGGSGTLDTVASRLDHLVVAVEDAAAAAAALTSRFGFQPRAHLGHVTAGVGGDVAVVGAGGVDLVLVGRGTSGAIDASLDEHGPGVHVAMVEVLNAAYARAGLVDDGADGVGAVRVDGDGHEEFLVDTRDTLGVRLGFLSRTGHRVGIGTEVTLALLGAQRTAGDPETA